MEALQQLEAVLCDPEGRVCINGSDGDRREIQEALQQLRAYLIATTAERDELMAALSKYGHHIEGCGHGWDCHCGFYKALAKVGADKTGEG